MRVMVIIKATPNSEAGVMPTPELLAEMGRFNEELIKAGVLVSGEGLRPSSEGARVRFANAGKQVTRGPFKEIRELVAGFWIWQVDSLDAALEWAQRCPDPMPAEESCIELRPLFEANDFAT
jgi:hypothetical protein